MSDDDVSERDLFGSDDDDDDVPAPTPVVPAPTPSTWQLKKSTNLTPFQKQDLFTVLGNTNRDMTEGLLRSAVYGDGQLNPPRGEDPKPGSELLPGIGLLLPCGSGKTVVALALAMAVQQSVLVVVESNLVAQMLGEIEAKTHLTLEDVAVVECGTASRESRGGDPRMLTDEESNACFKEAGERAAENHPGVNPRVEHTFTRAYRRERYLLNADLCDALQRGGLLAKVRQRNHVERTKIPSGSGPLLVVMSSSYLQMLSKFDFHSDVQRDPNDKTVKMLAQTRFSIALVDECHHEGPHTQAYAGLKKLNVGTVCGLTGTLFIEDGVAAGVQLQKQLEQAYPSKPHGCQRSLADLMDSRSIARVHFHRKEVLYPSPQTGWPVLQNEPKDRRALYEATNPFIGHCVQELLVNCKNEMRRRNKWMRVLIFGYRIDVLRHLQKEHMGAFPGYIDGEDQERFRKTCVERFRKGPRNYDEETGTWDGEFDEEGNRLADFREVLLITSAMSEGLNFGPVDLIIEIDTHGASRRQLIQRGGRGTRSPELVKSGSTTSHECHYVCLSTENSLQRDQMERRFSVLAHETMNLKVTAMPKWLYAPKPAGVDEAGSAFSLQRFEHCRGMRLLDPEGWTKAKDAARQSCVDLLPKTEHIESARKEKQRAYSADQVRAKLEMDRPASAPPVMEEKPAREVAGKGSAPAAKRVKPWQRSAIERKEYAMFHLKLRGDPLVAKLEEWREKAQEEARKEARREAKRQEKRARDEDAAAHAAQYREQQAEKRARAAEETKAVAPPAAGVYKTKARLKAEAKARAAGLL